MADFDIVDLSGAPEERAGDRRAGSVSGQGAAGDRIGSVDTAVVASELEALRQDLAAHVKNDDKGLHLTELTIKLTLGAEGKVAFVAKGTAEACIEVKFASSPGNE